MKEAGFVARVTVCGISFLFFAFSQFSFTAMDE
jgi:hypothetical protein